MVLLDVQPEYVDLADVTKPPSIKVLALTLRQATILFDQERRAILVVTYPEGRRIATAAELHGVGEFGHFQMG